MKRKGLVIAGLVAGLSVLTSMTAFAGEWKQDSNGWWWQNDDGSYPVSTWQWIDGNKDGLSESYYFNEAGYLVTNTTIDGYTVNADGAWTINGQIQTKGVAEGAQFIDFTSYFNMDLHTFANHFGYTDEQLDSKIENSRHVIDEYTFIYSGGITFDDFDADLHYVFAKDKNSENGISNELTAVFPGTRGLKGLMTGLTKEEYTISELEEIVRKAGATNIKKEEKVDKDSVWGVSSNGAFVPTGNYKNVYTTKLKFDYNGLRYTFINERNSNPLISDGWIERAE